MGFPRQAASGPGQRLAVKMKGGIHKGARKGRSRRMLGPNLQVIVGPLNLVEKGDRKAGGKEL